MKFSESWLREWVNPAVSTEELVAQLTMAGLEVDAVEPVAGAFRGVVVGEILAIDAHPDAAKLRICQVAGGAAEPLQVVCGAPNARIGIKVPFATVGAQLPNDLRIAKAKLRGVDSYGMLCAKAELAAGEDDGGLWELPHDAPVGEDLRQYLNLDDRCIEVDLTPNRGDCLSIKGMAREVGVLNRCDVRVESKVQAPVTIDAVFPVRVLANEACPVYVGRVVKGVDATRPSPRWLVEKLQRSGLRSIDAIVDVTNYVLLELGQPMHAFDLQHLRQGIEVRLSKGDETLKLLDGQTVPIKDGTLLIADGEKPLAIAGVMGGEASAVSASTRELFLESAFFAPRAVAGVARSYGLHTDSSHRFERGVDWSLQIEAIDRATVLLLDIVGGQAGPLVQIAEHSPAPARVTLRKARLAMTLGLALDDAAVLDILTRLGLSLAEQTAEHWLFAIPSHRFDLAIEEDLVEEVARVYGYDRLPTRATGFALRLPTLSETVPGVVDVKAHLASRGLQEVITYSFIDPALQAYFSESYVPVVLRNPISSEMSCMRTSLLPGVLSVLRTNLNRQKARVRCFETGLRFRSLDGTTAKLQQEPALAALFYGPRHELSWHDGRAADSDFYDLKGELETLLALYASGRSVSFLPHVEVPYLHPGQTALVALDGQPAGVIGALHPAVQKALEIPKSVFVFEVDLNLLLKRRLPSFEDLSRYPEVSRDLAVVVARDLPFQRISEAVVDSAGNCLTNLKLFDVYRGEGIDPERKSIAFSLTYQHRSRTLKDDEINASVATVVSRLEKEFGATLR